MNNKPKTSWFFTEAEKLSRMLEEGEITAKDIELMDRTEIFEKALRGKIKHKEIIVLGINGQTRMSKSTVGWYIGSKIIFDQLKKEGKRKKTERFGMQNVARDQIEKNRMMSNPTLAQTVILTDEFNEYEATGENSSTESQLSTMYSDVQAARYIHSINCSPRKITDPNTEIILTVYSKDEDKYLSRAYLFYKYTKGFLVKEQILGYVDFKMKGLVKNWLEIRNTFQKVQRGQGSPQDEIIIERWAEKDEYIKYMIKKHEKMELMNKENILKTRELHYAELLYKTLERLKDRVELTGKLPSYGQIQVILELENTKLGLPLSIIGMSEHKGRLRGMLEAYKMVQETKQTIRKITQQQSKTDSILSQEILQRKLEKLGEQLEADESNVNTMVKELERKIELKKKYDSHLGETSG